MRTILLSLLATLTCLILLAFSYQEQVTLAWINPDRSYEAYEPPPAPDYSKDESWFRRGDGQRSAANIFVIHSNVYRGDGGWNAPHDRPTQSAFLDSGVVEAEIEPFSAQGLVWVPRYRQPTLFARFTQKHPGSAARATAYDDILAAFERFLQDIPEDLPIIIAGYGDGALFAGKLWLERIAPDETLTRRVAVLYAVGMPLPARPFDSAVCQGADEPRCLLSFSPVDERFTEYRERLGTRTLTLDGRGGYVSTQGIGKLCSPPRLPDEVEASAPLAGGTIPWAHGARCEDGFLVHATPPTPLRRGHFFGQEWFPTGVNLFAEALALDAHERVQGALRVMAQEAMTAPPMADPEEVREVETKQVPY